MAQHKAVVDELLGESTAIAESEAEFIEPSTRDVGIQCGKVTCMHKVTVNY